MSNVLIKWELKEKKFKEMIIPKNEFMYELEQEDSFDNYEFEGYTHGKEGSNEGIKGIYINITINFFDYKQVLNRERASPISNKDMLSEEVPHPHNVHKEKLIAMKIS